MNFETQSGMSEQTRQYYSQVFGFELDGHEDTLLLKELESWIGTPYQNGMSTKGIGTDCSGFILQVYSVVYGIQLKRSAENMAHQITVVNRRKLNCGHLVFFNDWIGNIAHVGIYLGNGNFIHATSGSRAGITISNLNTDRHYSKRYWAGGYIKR